MANLDTTGNPQAEALRARIVQWLMEAGWQVGTAHDQDANWILSGDDGHNRNIGVVQPKRNADAIVVFAGLAMSQENQAQFQQWQIEQQRALIFELRQNVMLLDVRYAGIGLPLVQMTFSRTIYMDGLTKDHFLAMADRVRNGVILARTIIARRFNEPPPPPEEPRTLGFRLPPASQSRPDSNEP